MSFSKAAVTVCALWFGLTAPADTLRVVSTGDSITNGYGAHRLQAVVADLDQQVEVVRIASSGATTARYLAQEVDPGIGSPQDYVNLVLAQQPDVVLLMLGTNDAMRAVREPEWLEQFFQNYREIVDRFQASEQAPTVLIATLIPIVAEQHQEAAAIVDAQINPFLRLLSLETGTPLIDLNRQIRTQPNWTGLYSDGIHLWANGAAGYWWMAERFSSALPRISGETGCPCVADLNCNGSIDLGDLAAVVGGYGRDDSGDLNFDQRTDLFDLQTLLARFGTRCR